MFFVILFAIVQIWSSDMDYYDRHMDAYYQHIEGQDARYKAWMQAEQSRILSPMLDVNPIIEQSYSRLASPTMYSYATPIQLFSQSAYTTYAAPNFYFEKPTINSLLEKSFYQNYQTVLPINAGIN